MRRIPTLAEVERRHILDTLDLCENNRTRAAKVLGLSIRGLRLKLHEYEHEAFRSRLPSRAGPIMKWGSPGLREAPEARPNRRSPRRLGGRYSGRRSLPRGWGNSEGLPSCRSMSQIFWLSA